MFFNEVELLDLRLRTLDAYVDFFVIAEINITHSGLPKPYIFEEYSYLFEKYKSKIIYLKDICYPQVDPWIVENAHRNVIAKGIVNADPDDYIIISDLDEIPNPVKVIEGIKIGYQSFGLNQDLYCYFVNCKSYQQWQGSVVLKKKLIQTPQIVRNNRLYQSYYFDDGGWHYTSMGGKERIRTKFKSFAETAFNIPQFMSDENLDKCLTTGKDLTDRPEKAFQKRFIKDEEITHKEIFEWSKQYPNFKTP
jgi:beta-1,4-mannosyl-glycoprotein beta-1,4-N-acetylglucosaminyltransferase